jgi:hypothetical protein
MSAITTKKAEDGTVYHEAWLIHDKKHWAIEGPKDPLAWEARQYAKAARRRFRGKGYKTSCSTRRVQADCTTFQVACVVVRERVQVIREDCGCWVSALGGRTTHPCWRHH